MKARRCFFCADVTTPNFRGHRATVLIPVTAHTLRRLHLNDALIIRLSIFFFFFFNQDTSMIAFIFTVTAAVKSEHRHQRGNEERHPCNRKLFFMSSLLVSIIEKRR